MLSAVIFDMDGVIIDSHPAHRAAWRTFLREIGRKVTETELDFVLDGRKRSEILRHFLGNSRKTKFESMETVRTNSSRKPRLTWRSFPASSS